MLCTNTDIPLRPAGTHKSVANRTTLQLSPSFTNLTTSNQTIHVLHQFHTVKEFSGVNANYNIHIFLRMYEVYICNRIYPVYPSPMLGH